MSKPGKHFYENVDGLNELNARSYSSIDQSMVRVDNLPRHIGVAIAHNLTIQLDALGATGRQYNRKNFPLVNDRSDADARYLRSEPVVFHAEPGHQNFTVELKLPERREIKRLGIAAGKYSLIATAKELNVKGTKTPDELKEILQLGYISTLEKSDFFPTDEEIDIEHRLKKVGVPIPSDRKLRAELEEEGKQDTKRVEDVLVDLGVKDISESLVEELSEKKYWNNITVTDLFLHIVTQKQKRNPFPRIKLIDIVQTTDKVRADKLREDQEAQTFKIFEALGFEEGEMQRRYELYKGDEMRRLSLRYLAWLSSQSFMKEFQDNLSEDLREGKKITNAKLFELATGYAYEQYDLAGKHRHSRYDLSIDWQRADYERQRDFLKTAVLLCLNIFYDQDVSGLRKVK